MSNEGIIVCEECGCNKVQTVTWVEINTGRVFSGANSDGEQDQDNWCPDCIEHCSLTSKAIFNLRNK